MRVEQEIVNKYTVTAGVLSYTVTFPLYEESDVSVVVSSDGGESERALTLGTDYSVSINEDNSGGTVTLVSGVVQAGDLIALSSNLPYTQELDLSSVSTIDTDSTETQLDRTTQQIQQIAEQALRSVKVPVTSTTTPEEYMAAFWKAAKEVLASVGIVKDAEEYIQKFVAGIPLIRSNLSEVEAGPDGYYLVTGFGDAGRTGNDISNRVVVADGSTKARKLGERAADVVNVRDFGAVGDGVTDDTAAFRNAIASDKSVFVPDGNYVLRENIDLSKCYGFGKVFYYNSNTYIPNTIDLYEKHKSSALAIVKNQQDIETERNRIDSLMSLPEGSTSLDAEVIDIRTGYNGESYSSAGGAVREQFKVLENYITGEDVSGFCTKTIDISNLGDALKTQWNPNIFVLSGYKDFQSAYVSTISFFSSVSGSLQILLVNERNINEVGADTVIENVATIEITESGYQTHAVNIFVPYNKILAFRTTTGSLLYGGSGVENQYAYTIYPDIENQVSGPSSTNLGVGIVYIQGGFVSNLYKNIKEIKDSSFFYSGNIQDYAKANGGSIYLKDIFENGFFLSGSVSTYVIEDWPEGITIGAFILRNYTKKDENYRHNTLQIVNPVGSDRMAWRYIQNDSVGEWRYVGASPIGNLSQQYNGQTISLVDLERDGIYLTGGRDGYTISDAPFDGNFYLRNYIVYGYKLQVCYAASRNNFAWRHVNASNIPTEWFRIKSSTSEPDHSNVKWLALGDSLTRARISLEGGSKKDDETYGYAYKLNSIYLKYSLTVYGIVGIGLVSPSGGIIASQMIDSLSSEIKKSNIVTLALGTNDYRQSRPLGSVDSASGDGTICGNMKECFDKITLYNSKCNVHFIAPFLTMKGDKSSCYSMNTPNSAGYTQKEMHVAMQSVCELYGVSFIDLSKIGAITAGNAEESLPDGTHPSEEAYERIAHALHCHFM